MELEEMENKEHLSFEETLKGELCSQGRQGQVECGSGGQKPQQVP